MKAMPKIGVALYANGSPFNREGNFACEYRKQPFKFESASELPSQTLWVTNCTLNDLFEAGLNRAPKIAHEGYYRTRLAQMAHELGLQTLPLDQQAALLAELLGNATEMARLQLNLTQYPSNGLAQAVGQLYGQAEAAEGSAMLQVAEQSCQRYTACERERRYERCDVFSFWFPRHGWANRLLSEPLPINENLKALQPNVLPGNGRDVVQLVEWATENKLPLFARIKIHSLEPTVGRLMNYGAGAQNLSGNFDARNMREWCALPELETLSQLGDLEVLQVAIAGGWNQLGVHAFEGKLAAVSYGYGLVAENLWVGLTRKPSHRGNLSRTLSTAWIQSVDRMECLKTAERLSSIGFEIINYGNGRITVVCPQSVRALIPQVALQEGLMYPSHLDGLECYKPVSSNPGHVMQHLLSTRDYGRLVQVDQAALKELAVAHAPK